MSDRLQINLQRTYNEVLESRDEYNTMLANNPRPWSKDTRIKLGSRLQVIKQHHSYMLQALEKWEDLARKTKDADQRTAEYERS
uniref:Uncharacterized protein n=1 Tax=Panagrolaimus davidi TaxID=227884 RepID=A0A914QNR1_9BILA